MDLDHLAGHIRHKSAFTEALRIRVCREDHHVYRVEGQIVAGFFTFCVQAAFWNVDLNFRTLESLGEASHVVVAVLRVPLVSFVFCLGFQRMLAKHHDAFIDFKRTFSQFK